MEIGATLERGEKRNEMVHQHSTAAVERRGKGGGRSCRHDPYDSIRMLSLHPLHLPSQNARSTHTPRTKEKKDTFSAAKSVTCNHSASVLPFCLRLPHARSRTKGGEGEKEGGRREKKG